MASADERDEDRVHHRVGLVREEGELQQDARRRRSSRPPRARAGRPAAAGAASGRRAPRARAGRAGRRGPPRRRRSRPPGSPAAPSRRARSRSDRRGRELRAAQVVEDLPARDEGQAVAREARARRDEREEPAEDLPVAARPAVLAARVGEDARRVVVHHLDVGHEAGAGVEPLEEVVREERVVGDAPVERRREGVDVVEPLAGEAALAEEVLVGVRDGGGVRVDAGVPGEDAREARARGARGRDADARLQDPVALGDAAAARVEAGPVERVRDDADELLRAVAREARVRVERDAVAHAREDARARRPARRSSCRSRRAGAGSAPRASRASAPSPSTRPPPGSTGARGGRGRSGRPAPRRGARSAPRSRSGPRRGWRRPPGMSRAAASAKSPRIAKWMRGSRFPSARTSRCSRSRSTPSTLVSSVGTTTRVRASSGMPAERSRRGSRRGGARRAARRWTSAMATSLAGRRRSSATPTCAQVAAALVPGVRGARRRRAPRCASAIAPRYDRGRVREGEPAQALRRARGARPRRPRARGGPCR